MGDISTYFSRSEFACECGCGFAAVDIELLGVLEDLREFFKSPVTINSGCRCEEHNHLVGGSSNSQHVKGMAADIRVKNALPGDVADYLEDRYSGYGIGRYDSWVHVDVRPSRARWKV